MSLPSAVFLDTSILDGQNYNFGSVTFTSFVALAKAKNLRLILPDPTRREVQRHIRERSLDAIRALKEAKRAAPFLSKWSHFPKFEDAKHGEWEVHRVASNEWRDFLTQFTVTNLDYKAIDLSTVMNWYDAVQAPFAAGKKRKEFPDAFAIAALAAHAQQGKTYIAVVSADQDFKSACDHFTYLLYFPSLPALSELLLSDDAKIDALRRLVKAYEDELCAAVCDAVTELPIYHSSSRYNDIDDVDIHNVSLSDMRIVGLGDLDCTVAFDTEVEYSARLRWLDEPDRFVMYYRGDPEQYHEEPARRSREVSDSTLIAGTAKLRFADDKSRVEQVVFVDLNALEIEMTEEP